MMSVTLMLATVAALGSAEPVLPDAKCASTVDLPGHDRTRPIMVVDENVVIGSRLVGVRSEDIHKVEIHCWNPLTLDTAGDDEAGLTIVLILTEAACAATAEDRGPGEISCDPDLEANRAAVREYVAEISG